MPEDGYRVQVVGLGGTTPTTRHERGALGRPHWWGVLAVSLALMALVAALSAPARHTVATPGGPTGSAQPESRAPGAPTRGRVPSGPTTGGADPGPVIPTTQPGSGRAPPIATVSSPGSTTATTSPPSTTAASVPSTVAPPGTTTTTAPAVPAPTTTTPPAVETESQPGNLEYPDNVSAQYPIDSGGGVSVVADFSGAPALDLSVSCPGGQADRDGASGVSVSVGGPAGPCTVEISEPSPQSAPVSYTLTVQYPPS